MMAGYVGVINWPLLRQGLWWEVARRVGFLVSAAAVGMLLTMPADLDLYVRYRDSPRFWVR
jgi:hypothetical protein